MTSDLIHIIRAKNALLNGASPRLQNQFWMELQIGDKCMLIISHERYREGVALQNMQIGRGTRQIQWLYKNTSKKHQTGTEDG